MYKLVVTALLAVAGLLLLAELAGADAGGGAVINDGGIDHGAYDDGSEPGGGSESGCEYLPATIPDGTIAYDLEGNVIPTDMPGAWFERWCDGQFGGNFYIPDFDPVDLALQARDRLALPLPVPALSPVGDQVVNLVSWLWIDPIGWEAKQSSVSAGSVTVTVMATSESVTWSFGPDDEVVCDGPGTPYDPSIPDEAQSPSCFHVFNKSSAGEPDEVTRALVTVRWNASWTVSGARGGGPLGTVDQTTIFAVRVVEIQAINTRGGT